MNRVKKRSGELQEFDRARLVESITKAGADEQVANRIAEKVKVVDGASTLDLRKFVIDELRNENPGVAEAYARTLRLHARARDDLPRGAARVPKAIERVPNVKLGQPGRLRHGQNRLDVRLEPALEKREVWLSRTDLEALGASEGARIAVRFLPETGGASQPQASQIRQPSAGATMPKGS